MLRTLTYFGYFAVPDLKERQYMYMHVHFG